MVMGLQGTVHLVQHHKVLDGGASGHVVNGLAHPGDAAHPGEADLML